MCGGSTKSVTVDSWDCFPDFYSSSFLVLLVFCCLLFLLCVFWIILIYMLQREKLSVVLGGFGSILSLSTHTLCLARRKVKLIQFWRDLCCKNNHLTTRRIWQWAWSASRWSTWTTSTSVIKPRRTLWVFKISFERWVRTAEEYIWYIVLMQVVSWCYTAHCFLHY